MKFWLISIVLSALISIDSRSLAAPVPRTVPGLSYPIEVQLAETAEETMVKMQEVFPFIVSHTQTKDPSIHFGLRVLNDSKACSKMREADKLLNLFRQLKKFENPVDLVHTSTRNITSKQLKDSVENTAESFKKAIKATAQYMDAKQIDLPSVKNVDESLMDDKTATYLTKFQVQHTPDVVSNYRNYVIIYVLHDVLENSIRNCIPSPRRHKQ